MAEPTKYTPEYPYSAFQANEPTKPLPAPQVDNDFANISHSVNQTIDALKDVRRSDGALQNQIVGPDQISPALNIGFTNRGQWALGQVYSGGDGVVYDEKFYSSRAQHLATNENRPDLDPNTWQFLFAVVDFGIPDDSVTGEKLVEGAVGERELAPDIVNRLGGVNSRAWAIADLHPISAPDFIRTAGYSAAGDGSGALYKKALTEPSHAGKFSITLADGVTVVWYEIAETRLLPEMFGAVGDGDGAGGGTDDTDALEAMRDAGAALKLPMRLRRGRIYKITRSWDISAWPVLDGRNTTIDMSAISSGDRHGIIAQGGGLSNGPALSANGTERSYTVNTGATTALAMGEDVLITSEGFYPYSGYNVAKGEVKRIRSLTSNSVTFTTPLNDSYLYGAGADSARIRKVAWLDGVDIKRLRIIGSGSPTSGERGLCLRFCRDFNVSDITLDGQQQYQIEVASCLRGRVEKCNLNGVYYDGVSGSTFYGIIVSDASTDVIVAHCFGMRNRHLVVTSSRTAGQGHYGEPCDVTVIGCHQKDSQAGGGGRSFAFEVHGFGRNVKFIGCTADGCYSFIKIENGNGTEVSGCSVRNYDFAAVLIGDNGQLNQNIKIDLTADGFTGSLTSGTAAVVKFIGPNTNVFENIDIKVNSTRTRDPGNLRGQGMTAVEGAYRNVRVSGLIDAGVSDANTTCVFIPVGADGIEIRDLTTIGYRGGVNTSADNTCVEGCRFIRRGSVAVTGLGVLASGNNARIKDNYVENLSVAFRVSGTKSLVANNVSKGCTTNTSDLGSNNTLRDNDVLAA